MPKLICISGMNKDEEYQLHNGENTIGRSDSNDICVLDKKSSRAPCKLVLEGKSMTLIDLGSTNGVRVNNTFIVDEKPIVPGDHIRIGQAVYMVSDRDSSVEQQELSAADKIRKQKKYNNLLQKTSFQTTQTSNLRIVKAEPDNTETGFIAYFNRENDKE